MRDALHDVNVRFMVPILYINLHPPPNKMGERFAGLYDTKRSHWDSNMQVHLV